MLATKSIEKFDILVISYYIQAYKNISKVIYFNCNEEKHFANKYLKFK